MTSDRRPGPTAPTEDLLRFLYLCPVGVVEIAPGGAILMLNPLASQLLMPLDPRSSLANLFELLEPFDHDLPGVLAAFGPSGTRLCTGRRIAAGAVATARHLDLTAVRLEGGRTMVALVDATQLVASEQAAREVGDHEAWQAEALRDSEQQLRLALNAAAAGAYTWYVPADEVHADTRVCARLGVPPGRPFAIERLLERIEPADQPHVRARIESVRHRHGAAGLDMEYRLRGSDGGVLWHHSVARVERDAAGAAVRVAGLAFDITTSKRAELELARSHAALQERTAELEQRSRQLRRLASELTLAEQRTREQLARSLHDHLQQLLFAARLKLDRLAGQGDVDDRYRQAARAVRVDIEEAMAAARSLSVELFAPVLHESGLPAAVRWLGGWMAQKYGLTVDLSCDERANPERKDVRTLIFASLRELLFNVVKHAHVSHAAVTLTLTPEDTVRLIVADQGVGFDPLAVWAPAEAGRAGLGLFSIRERLALLGGTLEMSSAPGGGARFTLSAPRCGEVPAEAAPGGLAATDPVAAQAPPRAAGPADRPIRVLIVDDHVLVREALRDLLTGHWAFDVVGEASDGRDALVQATALQPELVIMDVSMPHMDGVEATRRILEFLPHTKVVGLSTQEQSGGRHAIETAGAIGYLTKDGDPHRILAQLITLCQRGRS